MSVLSDLAEEIVETEFDSGADAPAASLIEAWLKVNLGKLNTLLESCFEGEDPVWDQEEPNIYKKLYMISFYQKKYKQAVLGILDGVDGFITVKEGDTVITKTNKNEVSKNIKGMINALNDELADLVNKYKIYNAQPVQIIPDF